MADRQRWGEDDDEEQVYETPVDDKGFKQRVRISRNDQGKKVRITTKIKVSERRSKMPKRVLERKNIRKFGLAAECDPSQNISVRSPDVIQIEHPDSAYKEDDVDPLTMAMRGKERAMERELEMGEPRAEAEQPQQATPSRVSFADAAAGGAASEPPSGRYIPPNLRGAGGASAYRAPGGQDNENTIRVSNLPKETTDNDIAAIFEPFGRLSRVSVPRKPGTKELRGFAYVAYAQREDAERAMQRLQRYAFGNLILVLEWAKPQSRDASAPPSGGLNSAFATGYGKKLAQDTTEKVSFASNLTR